MFCLIASLLIGVVWVSWIGEGELQTGSETLHVYTVGPRFFPRLAAGLLGLCSLLLLGQIAVQPRQFATSSARGELKVRLLEMLVFLGLMFGYVLLIIPLGIVVASVLFLTATLARYRQPWPVLCLVPILTCVLLDYCFEWVMDVQLPWGVFQ